MKHKPTIKWVEAQVARAKAKGGRSKLELAGYRAELIRVLGITE